MPEFRTELSATISNFSFAKLALVNDLKSAVGQLSSNDAVAAIAGDPQSRGRLGAAQASVDPRCLDDNPPDQDFCVVEADSSQQCAIAGIAAGQHAVIHGPPGTGKSQTITNLIATLVANGKRVLFVAEKRAALEVVQQRLEKSGLDHLTMDLQAFCCEPIDGVHRNSVAVGVDQLLVDPVPGDGIDDRVPESLSDVMNAEVETR
jgi:hypothetical protein